MDDESTEDNKPEDKKKPVSLTFTSDDIKLLVITFSGTLAANIVTVVFVGLALATAHSFNLSRLSPNQLLRFLLTTILCIILPIMSVVNWRRLRKRKQGTLISELPQLLTIFTVLLMSPIALFFILMWIGFAAGIK